MSEFTSCPITKSVLKQLNMCKAAYGMKNHSQCIELGLKAYVWLKLNHPEVELK